MKTLERHRREWEHLAADDPLWAVLTAPGRRHGGWEPEEFFATGEAEVAGVMATAAGLGLPREHGRALDFGCGAGRISRALGSRFERVDGVDIAGGMIDTARRLNADREHLHFHLNTTPDLRLFASDTFDCAYSSLTLQHLPGRGLALGYLAELVRVLRPGGLLAFQLPARLAPIHRLQVTRRLYALARALRVSEQTLLRRTPLTPMRMLAIPEDVVRSALERHGARVARVETLGADGQRYFATR
ncbi:MAG: class I SAM-dependent methyltransferase [Actinobacteria bacterium]|nr:class I SAM-dependent methyltransferase [Actinomycetota bacterium]